MIQTSDEADRFLRGRSFSTARNQSGETFCANGNWESGNIGIDITFRRGRWRVEGQEYGAQLLCVDVKFDSIGTDWPRDEICRDLIAMTGPDRLVLGGLYPPSRVQNVYESRHLDLLVPDADPPEC